MERKDTKMVIQERSDEITNHQGVELRFAQWVIRGDLENSCVERLKRGRRRQIEIHRDWLTPKDEKDISEGNFRLKEKGNLTDFINLLRGC